MNFSVTDLDGVYSIDNFIADDERGAFVKTFHKGMFSDFGICSEFKESYYSISRKNVIRGMHFQVPPHDHEKLVYVPCGGILDIIIDLRKKSATFGRHICLKLSSENRKSVFIPRGFAHGFRSLEDNTIVVYNVATVYNKESDAGIKWDSFGADWGEGPVIMSARDKGFPVFSDFFNPF
jgi:dTDP-4-dehydrorhamnose 3,5-epimerase